MDPPPPPLPTILTTTTSDPSHYHSLKLRIMVSYGGHILPRPHDKSLTYIGGTTRLLLLERPNSSVALFSHISHCLHLNSHRFTLKYQLPNDDLDSLVSLSSDEDLGNFLNEYDHLLLHGHLSSNPRIRLFLFFDGPTTATSLGPLLERPDDEGWFLHALNSADNIVVLPHSVSNSAANAADLLFYETDVGDDVSKLAPARVNVQIEDLDLDRMITDERLPDQGHKAGGIGKLPLYFPTVKVHTVHHKLAVSPDSVTSDSSCIATGSSLQMPAGDKPMNRTSMPDFPYFRSTGSEPAYLMPPSLVDHPYQVMLPQPQPALIQQQYGNTSANYIPHAAVTGAGQVFVQSYHPMYVVPGRPNITATGAHNSCAVSAPPLVQLTSGRHLPHQQYNPPGIRLSQSTAVSSTAYASDNPYNLFEHSHFYGQLPSTTKVSTPHYQTMAVPGAATSVSSETINQDMQGL